MLVAMVLVVTIVITSDCGHYCHHVGGHAWLMLVALVLVVVHSGGEDHHHCHCCVVVGVGSSGVVVVPLMVIAASHCHHMLVIITVITLVVINTGSGWHSLALALVGLVMGPICHCCHFYPGPGGHIVNVDGRVVVMVAASSSSL